MFKISDVISKPVYTIYEGVLVGTIISFVYDNSWKKIKGFFIFDDESDSEHYIESKNIYRIGAESVLIRNRSKIQISKFDKKSILNMKIASVDGSWVGEIREAFFDKNFKAVAVGTKEGVVIPTKIIVNVGQDIVIFDNNENKVNVSKMKPLTKILVENLPNIKVSILEDLENSLTPEHILEKNETEKETEIEVERELEKEVSNKIGNNTRNSLENQVKSMVRERHILSSKILSNPKSVIGKSVKKSLIGLNGEIIIKKGEIITEQAYDKAKKHSKIFELTNNV